MDPATLIGFVVSMVALLIFMIMEGADPMSLLFLPAIILVIVATFGAAMAHQTMDDLKKLPTWFKMAVMPAKVPPATEHIQTLLSLAEKARKEGLLALEAQVKDIDDPFLKRGLQMGIDGTRYIVSESVEEVLVEIREYRASILATAYEMDRGTYRSPSRGQEADTSAAVVPFPAREER